jgi:hypothetical protein
LRLSGCEVVQEFEKSVYAMMLDRIGPERLARGLTTAIEQQQRQTEIQVNTSS